ncbi:MAG: galactose mutarotase [Firmicutes bacterium]|nr:galactose mutarotase [Bacillota bacterium]
MDIQILDKQDSSLTFFQMENEQLRVTLSNLGCQLQSIEMKEADGYHDVILRPKDPEHPERDGSYMGCVVGRIANRIARGKFTLNGVEYTVATNNGPNHLHGGNRGFNCRYFDYCIEEDGIRFSYDSPDMEEGYPGNLHVEVKYVLRGSSLGIIYNGQSDRDTIINLTNHMYFNLSGGETILDHLLQVKSDHYLPVDGDCLCTGEILSSIGTTFDFNEPHVIGEHMDREDPQIINASGYDHAFVLSNDADQIVLSDEASGRQLTVSTDLPMVHVYSGNVLPSGAAGPDGSHYKSYQGICLETELCPDSINVEEEPRVILRKGETYHTETYYTFENIRAN